MGAGVVSRQAILRCLGVALYRDPRTSLFSPGVDREFSGGDATTNWCSADLPSPRRQPHVREHGGEASAEFPGSLLAQEVRSSQRASRGFRSPWRENNMKCHLRDFLCGSPYDRRDSYRSDKAHLIVPICHAGFHRGECDLPTGMPDMPSIGSSSSVFWQDRHAVPVGVETESRLDRTMVDAQRLASTQEGADQHQER